ncbi:MAG TPA: hypothetical protein VF792_00510 [Ktedonobacterales bacterium]
MHALSVVLLPPGISLDENVLYDALDSLLAPFYSELEPDEPMRNEYYDAHAIMNITARYCVRPTDLQKIAAKLRKALGADCSVDEHGLYYTTNLNPNRKLDYWTLHNIETDVWPARHMPCDLLPSAVITPDGHWNDTGAEKYASDLTADERQAIGQRAYVLMDQYPECWAVALDCHS